MKPLQSRRAFLGIFAAPLAGIAKATRDGLRPPDAGRELVLHRDRCLAWGGTDCTMCWIACPLRGTALLFEDQRPRLVLAACDGCGDCVVACRTVNDRAALDWSESPEVLEGRHA